MGVPVTVNVSTSPAVVVSLNGPLNTGLLDATRYLTMTTPEPPLPASTRCELAPPPPPRLANPDVPVVVTAPPPLPAPDDALPPPTPPDALYPPPPPPAE